MSIYTLEPEVLLTPEGVFMTDPTARVNLTLDQLRLLSKSVGKTLDAELKKLQRIHPGSLRTSIQEDLNTLDEIDGELKNAINELVNQ